jgi:hypothetical protein
MKKSMKNMKKPMKTLKDNANYQGSLKDPLPPKEEYGTGLKSKKAVNKAVSMPKNVSKIRN